MKVIKHKESYQVQRMSEQYSKFSGEGKGDLSSSCHLSYDVQIEFQTGCAGAQLLTKIPAMMCTLCEIVHHPSHKGFLGGMASPQNYQYLFSYKSSDF